MDLLQAIVLGTIQGITEWLPISSQGQSIAVALTVFGMSVEEALHYSIFLHLGTLIAATAYFRKEIVELLQLKDKTLLKFLAIAVVSTAATAIPTYLILRNLLGSSTLLLLLIGVFLIITGLLQMKKRFVKEAKLTNLNALMLGLGQGFSVLPGISRSGTTTSVLLFEGFEPEKAFRISFLLSVPSVFAAEILFGLAEPIMFELNVMIAVAVAAAVGFASIKLLLVVARRINFFLFCILFGLFYVVIAVI